MKLHASHFAETVNLPICSYLDSVASRQPNPLKPVLAMLSGDPTVYNNSNFKMPQVGYDLLVQSILNPGNHGYAGTVGIPSAREAILKLYKPIAPLKVADVIIHHNVNMGLLSVFLAVTNVGDEVVVPQLGYPFFEDLCPAMKRKCVHYRFRKDSCEIDLQHLSTLVNEKTGFIYLVNPANPTGAIFSRGHMLEIINFCDERELILVVDEVYLRQSYPSSEPHLSFVQISGDVPVIALCGVQKVLSVPGWSTSWLVLSDPHNYLWAIRNNLEIVATIFLHSNIFTQVALPGILKEVGLFTAEKMQEVEDTHNWLLGSLNAIKPLRAISAKGTIYMAVEIDCKQFKDIADDSEFTKLLFQEQSVNVLPLSILGNGAIQGFRLLTCAGRQFYSALLERMREFMEKHCLAI